MPPLPAARLLFLQRCAHPAKATTAKSLLPKCPLPFTIQHPASAGGDPGSLSTRAGPARTVPFTASFKVLFFPLPLQPFPFPKGSRGTLNSLGAKGREGGGDGLGGVPGGSTFRRFMAVAWQLAVAYQSTGNFIKRSILLSVSE